MKSQEKCDFSEVGTISAVFELDTGAEIRMQLI